MNLQLRSIWIFFLLQFLSGSKKAEKLHFKDVEKNITAEINLNCVERTTKQILTFMVNRYVFLHKMDNLFIDVKRKSIFYKINQRREPILRNMNGTVKNYSLNDESYERLVAILKKQEDKGGDEFGGKISSIESEVKNLGLKMEILQEMLEKMNEKISSSIY